MTEVQAGSAVRRGSSHPPLGRRTPFDAQDWFAQDVLDEARAYAKPLHRLKLVSGVVQAAALVAFTFAGGGRAVADAVGGGWVPTLVAEVAVVLLIASVLEVPFSAYRQLVYDKRWDLSTQTPARFAGDQVKEYVITVVMFSVLVVPVYAFMRTTSWWWLWGWAAFMAVQAFFVFVHPVVIMPRFNRFTPLEDGDLRRRIVRVAELADTPVEGVYTMDASKRTRRANAFVAGFGATKRVVLFDTILDYPPTTTEQVVAHEIGHYRLKHIPRSFPVIGALVLVVFAALHLVGRWDAVLDAAGVAPAGPGGAAALASRLGDPASFPLFLLVFGTTLTAVRIAMAWRARLMERQADLEALELLGDPTAFLDIWRRMVPRDKVELEPSWWTKLNHSHPEVGERMAFAKAWAEANAVPIEVPPPLTKQDVGSADAAADAGADAGADAAADVEADLGADVEADLGADPPASGKP